MDMKKSGELLNRLRISKNMTQKQIADILKISPKTVSKWERGRGFPDISYVSELAEILGVSTDSLLSGDISKNAEEAVSMKKTKFYVCPHCHSFMQGTGESEVVCCGSRVDACAVGESTAAHGMKIKEDDGQWYISFNHEMTKEHYIGFVAYVTFDRVLTVRMYPEQSGEVRIPKMYGGCFYYYCSRHGLFSFSPKPQSRTKKSSGASMTALMSAFARAYTADKASFMQTSENYDKKLFTNEEFGQIKSYISQTAEDADEYIRVNLAPTPAARKMFCRECLDSEIRSGAEQYVIIGSGYDTFACENKEKNLKIYEIDKETTVSDKLRRLARAGIKPADNVAYIKSDLEKFSVGSVLMTSDFDKRKKTLFSCLGLLYYLPENKISQLFEGLAAVCTEGSTVVFDVPDSHCLSSDIPRVKNMVDMAAASGEPMLSCFDYPKLERMLEKYGFLIYEFLNPDEIQQRYLKNDMGLRAFEHINYVLAVYKGK